MVEALEKIAERVTELRQFVERHEENPYMIQGLAEKFDSGAPHFFSKQVIGFYDLKVEPLPSSQDNFFESNCSRFIHIVRDMPALVSILSDEVMDWSSFNLSVHHSLVDLDYDRVNAVLRSERNYYKEIAELNKLAFGMTVIGGIGSFFVPLVGLPILGIGLLAGVFVSRKNEEHAKPYNYYNNYSLFALKDLLFSAERADLILNEYVDYEKKGYSSVPLVLSKQPVAQ